MVDTPFPHSCPHPRPLDSLANPAMTACGAIRGAPGRPSTIAARLQAPHRCSTLVPACWAASPTTLPPPPAAFPHRPSVPPPPAGASEPAGSSWPPMQAAKHLPPPAASGGRPTHGQCGIPAQQPAAGKDTIRMHLSCHFRTCCQCTAPGCWVLPVPPARRAPSCPEHLPPRPAGGRAAPHARQRPPRPRPQSVRSRPRATSAARGWKA